MHAILYRKSEKLSSFLWVFPFSPHPEHMQIMSSDYLKLFIDVNVSVNGGSSLY